MKTRAENAVPQSAPQPKHKSGKGMSRLAPEMERLISQDIEFALLNCRTEDEGRESHRRMMKVYRAVLPPDHPLWDKIDEVPVQIKAKVDEEQAAKNAPYLMVNNNQYGDGAIRNSADMNVGGVTVVKRPK